MINVRTIRKIQENGGMTLKLGRPIRYKAVGRWPLRAWNAGHRKKLVRPFETLAEIAESGLNGESTT